MKKVTAREIYFNDEIFAASATGTSEDAVKRFADSIGEDGYKKPRKGSKILLREYFDNFNEPTDWFEVKVT